MTSPPDEDHIHAHSESDDLAQTSHTQNPNPTQPQTDQDNDNPLPSPPTASSKPQPSETLTLEEEETQQNPNSQNPDPLGDDQNQEDPDGFNASSPQQQDLPFANSSAATVPRRGPKRKKGGQKRKSAALERRNRVKLETLLSKIKPIPFVPSKALDFASHEKLLQRLGLWNFVHLEFDSNIRVDLIAQLIANFHSPQRASYVNGIRIPLNRADMARALRLPPPTMKKDKGAVVDGADGVLESEESITFVEDLVSNWMLLHEDMWMMPDEVLKSMNVIKEGHLEKVEWATLIWYMVEKELTLAPDLENCYYASHLQCLIKSQREELFREEPKVEIDLKEEEEVDGSGDVKMNDAADDFQVSELEEHKIELSLGGQDHVEKDEGEKECGMSADVMDFEECKGEEPVQWFLDGKNNADEHFLRRCDLGEIKGSGFEEEKQEGELREDQPQEEEEEEQDDGGFHLSPNALSSDNLIQALDASQNPFGSALQLHDHSPGDFLSSRGESHMISDGPSLFNNAHKREYGNDNAISHCGLNGVNKRLRTDGSFDSKSGDFHMCMDQVQHLLGKARMMYETKEHDFAEANMNQQVLLNELQQRDNTIHSMHNQRIAEQHKREADAYRLERELIMMGNLLQNYRKALKETQRAFVEYRARFPHPEEPLYKDVPGSGGLVLSTTELEKQRLKQLEDNRLSKLLIQKTVNDCEVRWTATFNGHHDAVQLMGSKLLGIENEVGLFKELSMKRKASQLPESTECTLQE